MGLDRYDPHTSPFCVLPAERISKISVFHPVSIIFRSVSQSLATENLDLSHSWSLDPIGHPNGLEQQISS
jgi:hypothetical protein